MTQEMKPYQVMEWHRGELIPLKETNAQGKKGKGKIVKITDATAEIMNLDFDAKGGNRIKYVLAEEIKVKVKEKVKDAIDPDIIKKTKALQAKYVEVIGKKPFHGWDIETLTKKIKEHK